MSMILDNRYTDATLEVACEPEDRDAQKETLQVATSRFGALEVPGELVIQFDEGLIGFEACKRFVVIRPNNGGSFRWLQSLDEPAVAFPVLEPAEFRADYTPTISDADCRRLELTDSTPILMFAIVTIPASNPRAMTANLLGPLVINGNTRRAHQVIVQDDAYTTRHEVMRELQRSAELYAGPAASSLTRPSILHPDGTTVSGGTVTGARAA